MNAIEKERFLKLADFLDNLNEEKFWFGTEVYKFDKKTKCGTVCCAIGWTPVVFPDLVRWHYSNEFKSILFLSIGERLLCYKNIASTLFGISSEVCGHLFCPREQSKITDRNGVSGFLENLEDDAGPKEVANMMRRFLEELEASEKPLSR